MALALPRLLPLLSCHNETVLAAPERVSQPAAIPERMLAIRADVLSLPARPVRDSSTWFPFPARPAVLGAGSSGRSHNRLRIIIRLA